MLSSYLPTWLAPLHLWPIPSRPVGALGVLLTLKHIFQHLIMNKLRRCTYLVPPVRTRSQ
jgi:hypothetical protein